MSCLNKHSAQLEEVWLGGSRLYVHMEVTSYTNWKTRRASLHFFFMEGLQTGSLQLSSHPIFRRLCEMGSSSHRSGGGCSKVTFPAGVWAHSWWEQEEKGWAEQHGALPCCGINREMLPSLPPFLPLTERNWSLKNTTDILLAMQDTYVQCSRKLEMGISILT